MKEGLHIEVTRKMVDPYEYHGCTMYYIYQGRVVCYDKGKRTWSQRAGDATICRKYALDEASRLLADIARQAGEII